MFTVCSHYTQNTPVAVAVAAAAAAAFGHRQSYLWL
jgi:hypothetical protein